MRRKSFLALACALLVCVMMLSSCVSFGSLAFKKVFDASQQTKTDEAYAKSDVAVGLANMDVVSTANQLALFSKTTVSNEISTTKYVVYNMDTGALVYEGTTSTTNNLEIKLSALADGAFFTVVNTSWRIDSSNVKLGRDSVNTALYDAAGVKLAETYRSVEAKTVHDLIQFDGKCYRIDSSNAIAYAFDYSDLKQLPSIVAATEKYYFADNDNGISVYTKSLELKSSMNLPSYAEISVMVPLDEKKVLVQYTVEEEENAKKYDYIAEKTVSISGADDSEYSVEKLQKYSLYTCVFNGNTGKFKKVDLDYVIEECYCEADYTFAEDWHNDLGINKKCTNVVGLYPVEDQRINYDDYSIVWGSFDTNGKFKPLNNISDAPMLYTPYLAYANRWAIYDAEGREFIVDAKGKVVGETTNAYYRDTYIYAEGKMYDYDLNLIYDYSKDNLVVENALDECVLFRNIDNELVLYSVAGTGTLIKKDAKRTLFVCERDYFIIKDFSSSTKVTYEIYNGEGILINTVDASIEIAALSAEEVFNVAHKNDGKLLLKTVVGVNTDGSMKCEYYRLGA